MPDGLGFLLFQMGALLPLTFIATEHRQNSPQWLALFTRLTTFLLIFLSFRPRIIIRTVSTFQMVEYRTHPTRRSKLNPAVGCEIARAEKRVNSRSKR